jgi:hypothetical protein
LLILGLQKLPLRYLLRHRKFEHGVCCRTIKSIWGVLLLLKRHILVEVSKTLELSRTETFKTCFSWAVGLERISCMWGWSEVHDFSGDISIVFHSLNNLNSRWWHASTRCLSLLILALRIILSNFWHSIRLHRCTVKSNPTGNPIIRYIVYFFLLTCEQLSLASLLLTVDDRLRILPLRCDNHDLLNSGNLGASLAGALSWEELGWPDVHDPRNYHIVSLRFVLSGVLKICWGHIDTKILLVWWLAIYQGL